MTARPIITAAALAAALLGGGAAAAQSLDSNGAEFSAGWGRSPGQESRAYRVTGGRDADGNRLIVDGIIQSGEDQSSFGRSDGGSGAGYGGSTAVGNSLSVSVVGSWNTVIVDSTQINNGDVVAGRSAGELNGGVDLHD